AEIDLHQRCNGEGLHQGGLERPGEDDCQDEAPSAELARHEVDDGAGRRQHEEEDDEGHAPKDQRQPDGVLYHPCAVLRVEHHTLPGSLERRRRVNADIVAEDDLIDIGQREANHGVYETYKPLQPRYGEQGGYTACKPGDGANRSLHQLVDDKEDVGLSETLRDDLAGIGNLVLPIRHVPTIDQMYHDGDVTRLHHIEDVFADPVDDHGHQGEAGEAAVESGGFRSTFGKYVPHAPSDASPHP